MANSVMLQLGNYVFSMSTARYQELRRSTEYVWASNQRLGQKPSLQFIAEGEESLTLQGVILPHYKGGLFQVDAMREEAGTGEPRMLVDSFGYVRGKYAIKRIEETLRQLTPDGIPRKIEFSLSLIFYDEQNQDELFLAGYDPVPSNDFTA